MVDFYLQKKRGQKLGMTIYESKDGIYIKKLNDG